MIVCGGPWVFLLAVLGALFLWRTSAEDKVMARQFPQEFPQYERSTKKLVPFVF